MVVQPSISGDIADGLSVVLPTLPSLYNSPQGAMIVQLEKGVLRRARAVRNHDFGGIFLFCHVIAYYYFLKAYQVWYVLNIILLISCWF